ncbi:hypothetical protein [Enterococcus hulanensis]|uniref:hypothetical protein n=1 Tax=Enterococcus hulanensis TaxID=2559929 RepID=UPI001485ADD4|nr:hypothetical protein [Enterococcus hulanensis]
MDRALTGKDYAAWIASFELDEETQEAYEWKIGIAPLVQKMELLRRKGSVRIERY